MPLATFSYRKHTATRSSCKETKNQKNRRGSGGPLPLRRKLTSRFRLELLRQLNVNKPSSRVVEEARITGRVTTETVSLRRVDAKDVIAAEGNGGAIEHALPDRQAIAGALSRGAFHRLAILAALHVL